ncbi:hypothetical protein E4K64_33760 [Bradyrhizobium frederickii]|uniref:Porin n=1 Tax=Bradyrhizobium frederickii TaxID=2560054 RepID=A0A4Y9NMS8_9BRAD|nr:hypothetical protein [Bradyrhizobium frederickii]TFV69200.1 hypothetical protein E4K64_33760 [Bradyrhizobium frederickii]
MRRPLLVLISLLVTTAAAAEALRLPPAERPQAGATAAPLKGAAGSKARGSSCASYGPRFVMVEGTGTCVKIDGSISVDTTVRR